jgi:hypothetical protein
MAAVKFEVLRVVIVKICVLWDKRRAHFYPEEEGRIFIRNAGKCLPDSSSWRL